MGAGHQHFSFPPTLNLVKEAKFLVNADKRSIDPFLYPAPKTEREEAIHKNREFKNSPQINCLYLKQRAEKFKSQNALKNNSAS